MAFVQASSPLRTQGALGTISLPGVAAGNALIVVCSNFGSGFTSVTGSVNGAFTKAVGIIDNGNNAVEVWYRLNTSSGSETISFAVTSATGDTYISAVAMEWSGVVTASALDRTGTGADSLTATASAANTQASELVIHATVCDTGNSALGFGTPSGYTLLDRENDSNNYTGYQAAYKTVAATETSTGTATSSALAGSNFDSVIATFKLGSAPTAYDLAYGSASYALTASAETLAAGRKLPVTAASYAITPAAETLAVGRKLVVDATSYALTNSAETLVAARKLDIGATFYALSAADVTLTYTPAAKAVDFAAVSYTLSTSSETLAVGRSLPVVAASYALTASAQTLAVGRVLDVDAVAYSISAAAVTLTYAPSANKALDVDPASYQIGPAEVTFAYSGASGRTSGGSGGGKVRNRNYDYSSPKAEPVRAKAETPKPAKKKQKAVSPDMVEMLALLDSSQVATAQVLAEQLAQRAEEMRMQAAQDIEDDMIAAIIAACL